MAFAHLDDVTQDAVLDAALTLGFADPDQMAALSTGIPPAFVATGRSGGNDVARLMTFLTRLNTTRVLVSGEVPLRTWLRNAIRLAGGSPEEDVFRLALERASTDGAAGPAGAGGPAPARPADVTALPRSGDGVEIAIGEDDTLGVEYLVQGVAAARSVARLWVHRHFDGHPSMLLGDRPDLGNGTGWVIAPRLLITNEHVVNGRGTLEPRASATDFALQAAATVAEFDAVSATAAPSRVEVVDCLTADTDLDFALLRLPDTAAHRPPLRLRGTPIRKAAEAPLRERVNVLQHPDGGPMRLGFRDNFVVAGTETRLSYLTDTAGGSSGSPLCDDAWFVAGLHRGYSTITGEPLDVRGKAIKQENHGTPIGAILAHLARHHPDLAQEIADGQDALG